MRRLPVIAVLTGCLLLTPAAALASRRPTPRERTGILTVMPKTAYPRGWYHLVIRVSTLSSRWAVVRIRANKGHARQVQPDLAVFHKRGGRWHLYAVHCLAGRPIPAAVARDLHIYC